MALEDKKQPIIVKKIKKGGHGHHGGAWKVAYADFVTAMMAFFLLMWLLGSTTQSEREGISDFFQNPSGIEGPGGASTSMIKLGGALDVPRGEGDPLKGPPPGDDSEELAKKLNEQAQLDELMSKLKEQIKNTPSLKDFKDQLLLDITSEGLRIQIVDRENRPMFDSGSAELKWYTKEILHELARTINEVPNHVSITGHTDATPFGNSRPGYSNWELSADRANSARREMNGSGMGEAKFGRVVGLASSVLFNKENPHAPVNRRISIVVLNRATEKAIGLENGEKGVEEAAPTAEHAYVDVPKPPSGTATITRSEPQASSHTSEMERELSRAVGH